MVMFWAVRYGDRIKFDHTKTSGMKQDQIILGLDKENC